MEVRRYYRVRCTNELAHYGTKGMEWGVRNYQNYDGSYTAAGRARYGIGKGRPKNKGWAVKQTENKTKLDIKDKGSGRNVNYYTDVDDIRTKTSDVIKRTASGAVAGAIAIATTPITARLALAGLSGGNPAAAAIAAGSLATGGAIVGGSLGLATGIVDKHKDDKIVPKVREVEEDNKSSGKIDEATGFYKKSKEYSQEEDIQAVNPGYEMASGHTQQNCALCSITYDLRRRGYAVTSNYTTDGATNDQITSYYKNPEMLHACTSAGYSGTASNFWKDTISQIPEVSKATKKETRGIITCTYVSGTISGGHAMAYETHKDGTVDIIDAQVNKVYKDVAKNGFGDHDAMFNHSINMSFVRTDNLEIDADRVKEVSH